MPYLFICLDVRKESRAHGIKATGNLFWSNIVERKTRLFQLPFSGSPMYHTAKRRFWWEVRGEARTLNIVWKSHGVRPRLSNQTVMSKSVIFTGCRPFIQFFSICFALLKVCSPPLWFQAPRIPLLAACLPLFCARGLPAFVCNLNASWPDLMARVSFRFT